MEKIKVWTKQNKDVLKQLEKDGRYIARKDYIMKDLQEHADLVLEVYDWLSRSGPLSKDKPKDVSYPIWVSFKKDATMMNDENSVILELELDPSTITHVNIEKWGMILNYSYIPANEADAKRHRQLLADYGVSDSQAYMSRFYPQIKMEIMSSWSRLFDDNVKANSDACYGNIWEVKEEWITQIIK